MPEMGEFVAVSVESILKHDPDNCPFCQENKKTDDMESCKKANPEEDTKSDFDAKKAIDNESGQLDQKMTGKGYPRPADWYIRKVSKRKSPALATKLTTPHKITPNPHHLIPGNESLLRAKNLLKWLYDEPGSKIEKNVGYNVNNAENGIWLPSNNSMRGNKNYKNKPFKIEFAEAAMKAAENKRKKTGPRQFHDRHNKPYSFFVKGILEKIATRMGKVDVKCPYKTEKVSGGKYKPPYALVPRLNGVSARLRGFLETDSMPNRKAYTSKLVPMNWVKRWPKLKKYWPGY